MPPPHLSFEFDPAKAASNLKKHGVDFLEAITVFNDPLSSTLEDDQHSLDEVRSITVGMSSRNRIQQGTNVVLIAPDLLDTFPDSESVNEALRSLKKIAARARIESSSARYAKASALATRLPPIRSLAPGICLLPFV